MLDDIREWISDNLRYILLGLAVILVLVIAFFAFRLITGGGSSKQNADSSAEGTVSGENGEDTLSGDKTSDNNSNDTGNENRADENQTGTDNDSDGSAGDGLRNDLVRNQEDVQDVVTRYYTARSNKDYDTLSTIYEKFDDDVRAEYETQDAPIESYSNIITYSKAGLTEGSYVVFAYFDIKLTGIDTLAPTLRGLYLTTNEAGDLIISDPDSHPEQQAYAEQVQADADVQALMEDVNKQYEQAKAKDPDLASFADSMENGSGTAPSDTDTQEGDGDTSGGTTGTVYANTDVNVRGTPSRDGVQYGTLMQGMQAEVLENLDSGWSKVRYVTSDGTTIEGYAMTQYLSAQ